MSNDFESITEGAKALQETAKLGTELVGAARDVYQTLDRALGSVLEDVVGVVGGDWLSEVRIHNKKSIAAKTAKIIVDRGIIEAEPPSPRMLISWVEAACNESVDTIQDLWVRLLANTIDPDRDIAVRTSFMNVLKQLEPIDAQTLSLLWERYKVSGEHQYERRAFIDLVMHHQISKRLSQISLSVGNLESLGLIMRFDGGRQITLTDLFYEIMLACDE